MVLSDPDYDDLDDWESTEIFVPGKMIERSVDFDRLFRILIYTGIGFGITIGLTFIVMIPLIAYGLIYVNPTTFEIVYAPWTLLCLTLVEFGFIIPPVYYVRKNNLSLKSIGIRLGNPIKEVLLGLGFGIAMLGANIIITYFFATYSGLPFEGADQTFFANSIPELIGWVVVMFVVVGLSEEILFRGFLQRRMDIYFREKTNKFKIVSLLITSFIFAAIHLDLIGLPARFVLGIFLGYLAQRRRYSMVGPTVAHGFNNAAVVLLASLGF